MKQNSISVVVPIYNEEKHLEEILNSLCSCTNIDEIICVDDGSQDRSLEILHAYSGRIRTINFQTNRGKGSAIAAGIKAANGDVVIFLDADLLNLDHKHIDTLVEPLLTRRRRAVVGYCKSSDIHFKLGEFISGQRAYYKKDLLPYLDEMEGMRYGIEMYLNSLFHPSDVEFIPLTNLRSVYKFEKYDSRAVAHQYLVEGKEIFQALPKTIFTERFIGILVSRMKDFLPLV